MEKIIITEEAFAGMRDYVPLREKLRFLDEAADGCFDRMELKIAVGADSLPMPPLYKENAGLKARMLMGAFVRLYVGAEFEADERCPWLMSEAEYDRWAGSHVMNQIRRFKKKDGALRDKAYDLLADWADVEQRFGCEVRAMLEVMRRRRRCCKISKTRWSGRRRSWRLTRRSAEARRRYDAGFV